ncbi:DNA-binding protein [Deinococcus aerius]|uniref:DNA-binding protein n=1 Tax=Deinococcus aerius TaxID=200253 RepID=A0A2I9DP83_9DEIO|nr:nucleotide-binding protein [Deinococcus aerius]GBF06951.1 DNA-binding protein [Deinococcus aerius]
MAEPLHQRRQLRALQRLEKALANSLSQASLGSVEARAVDAYIDKYLGILRDLKNEDVDGTEVLEPFQPLRVGYSEELYTASDINRVVNDIRIAIDILSEQDSLVGKSKGDKIFITHGRDEQWRRLQAYLEKQLRLNTIELSQQAYRGRHTLTKLDQESNNCNYAIIVMTGDDITEDGASRARENVIHEIGFFQAKFGIERVCLMYEIGTSIPSNIDGLGRVQFEKGRIEASFSDLHRELQEFFDV